MRSVSSPHSILILDDDEIDRMILKRGLSKSFDTCVFSEAANKAQFLEQLSEGVPDLIICDVNLKPDSGFDVMREAMTQRPGLSVPIVFTSGVITKAHRSHAREFFPYCILEKPANSTKNAGFAQAVIEAFNAPRNGSAQPKPA